jgi:hypothetical protein
MVLNSVEAARRLDPATATDPSHDTSEFSQ